MDGLIELIFERVPDGAVDKLLHDLLQGQGILELSHSELGSLEPTKGTQKLLPLLLGQLEPTSIFVRTANTMIGGVSIRSPLVRILRFDELNEVAVVFDRADVSAINQQDAVTMLWSGANVLARSAGVPEYYCGFEPATDESTRLFSTNKIGPLVAI